MKFQKSTITMAIAAFAFASGSAFAVDDIGLDNDDVNVLSHNTNELLSNNDLEDVANNDNDNYNSGNSYSASDMGNVDDVGNVDDSGNTEQSNNDFLSDNTLDVRSWDHSGNQTTNTNTTLIDVDISAIVNSSDLESTVSGANVSYGITDADAELTFLGLEVGGTEKDGKNVMNITQQNAMNYSFSGAAGINTAAQNAGSASSIQQSVSTNAAIMPGF